MGISFDMIMRVYNFIFPSNFVILDYEVDTEMSIIMRRLFISIGRELFEMEKEDLKFRVNSEDSIFNIQKLMKQPTDMGVVSIIDCIDDSGGFSYWYLDEY